MSVTKYPVMSFSFTSEVDVTVPGVCMAFSDTSGKEEWVKIPAAAGATQFVGVANSKASKQSDGAGGYYYSVDVIVQGIAEVISDGTGAIKAGDALTISNVDTAGYVKGVTPSFGGSAATEIVGMAITNCAATKGNTLLMLITPCYHKP